MTVPRRDFDHAGRSKNRRPGALVVPLVVLHLLISAAAYTPRLVSADHDERTLAYRAGSWSGKVYVAAFGDPMEKSRTFQLLLPPPGEDLCQMPDLEGMVVNTNTSISSSPIATWNSSSIDAPTSSPFLDYDDIIGLLIPRGKGECSEEVQTRVALRMQDKIKALRYLIIHGTDAAVGSTPVTLNLYNGGGGGEGGDGFDGMDTIRYDRLYRSMGVLYMPFTEYIQLEDIIHDQAVEQNATFGAAPYLLDPASAHWYFTVSTNGKIRITTDVETSIEGELFYWLRMVLFVVLIVTPCFRAGYLWYAGGGRLHWRRNENGRIIGILYVPPMPIWIWLRRQNQRDTERRISPKLSEEQFNQLPIITYRRNKKYLEDPSESAGPEGHVERGVLADDNDVEQGGESSLLFAPSDADTAAIDDKLTRPVTLDVNSSMELRMQRTEDTEDMNIAPSMDSLSMDLGHSYETSTDHTSPMMTGTALSNDDDAAAPFGNSNNTTEDYEPHDPATTCTMCSICIDDFETGEELVLLPRCKHAFHKECIQPWLLERQGCCPLCKVRVFDDGYSEDTVVEGGTTTSVEDGEGHPLDENHHPAVVAASAANGPTIDSAPHDTEDNRTTTPARENPPTPSVDDIEIGPASVPSEIATPADLPLSDPTTDNSNDHKPTRPVADHDLESALHQRIPQVEVVLQELPTTHNHQGREVSVSTHPINAQN